MNLVADRSTFVDRPFGCPPPSDEQLAAAYRDLGSVWKVGERFAVSGQWVHKRLGKSGVDTSIPPEFTDAQKRRIRDYYANTPADIFCLDVLAVELHKSRQNIARFARREGLTNRSRPGSLIAREKGRKPKWQDKAHPRGMQGKKHTPEVISLLGERSRETWSTWKTFGTGLMTPEAREKMSVRARAMQAARPASSNYTRTKGGHRQDLNGIYFRSSWEANYARYLNLLIKFGVVESWQFEPETFWFEGVSRGAVTYKPDFRIKYKGDDKLEYIEVKGWVVAKDRTKWRRMKKYHPHIKLVVVGAKEYYALQKKWASAIPEWETKTRQVQP